MSRVFSFRDLRLIDELSGYNEIELLHPSMDDKVNGYLEQLGFDLNKGILYVPNKHRDLQGNIGLGFRAVGEIALNTAYLDSKLCTLIERILAAARVDLSLAKEMSLMLGNSINFASQTGEEYVDEDAEEFPPEHIEPDYEDVSAQIKTLENIRDSIRGPYLNDFGNVKTPEEYKNAPVGA